MITSEFNKTYQTQIGDTVYTITSECDENETEDILDALVRLIKRDIGRQVPREQATLRISNTTKLRKVFIYELINFRFFYIIEASTVLEVTIQQ